jgi:hypothetical protein
MVREILHFVQDDRSLLMFWDGERRFAIANLLSPSQCYNNHCVNPEWSLSPECSERAAQ